MVTAVEEIRSVLMPVFARYGIRQAVLFGSFAKGIAGEQSDVDLLVDSRLRGLRFVGFTEAVRQAVERPVDVLDVTHIEKGSPIEREIYDTGVMIYEG